MILPTIILHLLAALLLPPLLIGIIAKTKAAFAGRVGPPWLQAYRDIIKLFRKGAVFSTTTTWIFKFGAVASCMTAAVAALLVPLGAAAPLSFTGDFILFAAVLGLGRFFLMLSALDTGSAFEGMGAAREATFACFAEPVLFFGLLVLARITGQLSLTGMLGPTLASQWPAAGPALLLILISWFIVLLAENCRIPFDDPNTHLELTMIHEVMVLDHGGPPLGMILYGSALKLFLFAALLVRLILPIDTGLFLLNWIFLAAGVVAAAFAVGVVESAMARLRMPAVPNLLLGAGVLSAFGLGLLIMGKS
jgi:formate hydrogenlyase subunit 4